MLRWTAGGRFLRVARLTRATGGLARASRRRSRARGGPTFFFRFGARAIIGALSAQLRDAILERNLELRRRLRLVVEVRQGDTREGLSNRALDGAKIVHLLR